MDLEGRITITLSPEASGHCSVSIHSNRPVHASRMFEGKSVQQTLQALPLLFSVCSTAQATAAARSCEQALNLSSSRAVEQAREQLLLLETIREHLWQPLFHWNSLFDRPADETTMARLMAIQQQCRQQLSTDGELFQPAPTLHTEIDLSTQQQQLKQLLEQQLFGIELEGWLQLSTEDDLVAWSQTHTTIAAHFIQKLEQQHWNRLGQCHTAPLPLLDRNTLEQQLQNDPFIEQPSWDGAPCESSTLTRSNTPLLQQLHNTYGNGLLTRTVARLSEIARLALQLDHPPRPITEPHSTTGVGIGSANAARGLLLHRVAIQQQQITRYQILAPTEWNFHPDGVVAHALQSLSFDAIDLEQQADQIIHAIDPCVGYDLVIND